MILIPILISIALLVIGCLVTRGYYCKQQRKDEERHGEVLAYLHSALEIMGHRLAVEKGVAAEKAFQVAAESRIHQQQTPQSAVASTASIFLSLNPYYPDMYTQWEDVRGKACASAVVVDTSVDPNGPYSPRDAHGT